MPTKFKYLEGDSKAYHYDMCLGRYLDGSCYEFATALHRGLGWPMVGLMQKTSLGKPVIRHAAVRQPDGKLRDVRGEITVSEFGQPFQELELPYVVREVTENDLRDVRPVAERAIDLASRLAEALWPELPWLSGQQKRYKEFADGLEELSRRTGVWIRSQVPACPPVLADAFGEEDGYVLEQTAEGLGFTIDRSFR